MGKRKIPDFLRVDKLLDPNALYAKELIFVKPSDLKDKSWQEFAFRLVPTVLLAPVSGTLFFVEGLGKVGLHAIGGVGEAAGYVSGWVFGKKKTRANHTKNGRDIGRAVGLVIGMVAGAAIWTAPASPLAEKLEPATRGIPVIGRTVQWIADFGDSIRRKGQVGGAIESPSSKKGSKHRKRESQSMPPPPGEPVGVAADATPVPVVGEVVADADVELDEATPAVVVGSSTGSRAGRRLAASSGRQFGANREAPSDFESGSFDKVAVAEQPDSAFPVHLGSTPESVTLRPLTLA